MMEGKRRHHEYTDNQQPPHSCRLQTDKTMCEERVKRSMGKIVCDSPDLMWPGGQEQPSTQDVLLQYGSLSSPIF